MAKQDKPVVPDTNKSVTPVPDPTKELKIAEIFNLTKTDAPAEKHLEPQLNPVKAWGNKKPKV